MGWETSRRMGKQIHGGGRHGKVRTQFESILQPYPHISNRGGELARHYLQGNWNQNMATQPEPVTSRMIPHFDSRICVNQMGGGIRIKWRPEERSSSFLPSPRTDHDHLHLIPPQLQAASSCEAGTCDAISRIICSSRLTEDSRSEKDIGEGREKDAVILFVSNKIRRQKDKAHMKGPGRRGGRGDETNSYIQ
jgi:hypothetical protein